MSVALDVDASAAVAAAPLAADVVQVVREALSNVRRHAGAQTCRVTLQAAGGSLRLEIEDDGRGLATEADAQGGSGLRDMKERAEILGGSFAVNSTPGEGTRVSLLLPLGGG